MKNIRSLMLVSLLSIAAPVAAQEDAPPPRGIWTAELPGGTFHVRLADVSSTSIHEFIVDGAARVQEVVIATSSPVVARFYVIEPITPTSPIGVGQSLIDKTRERAEEALSRVGADEALRAVSKSHPATTHAKTVEYRLQSREDLQSLFDHLQDHWLRNRPGTFRLEE